MGINTRVLVAFASLLLLSIAILFQADLSSLTTLANSYTGAILFPNQDSQLTQPQHTYFYTSNMSSTELPATLISRNVAKKVRSIETPEGDGAVVRRSIGTPALRNLSPFLMLDAFHLNNEGAGFPDHPHRGMSTVTLMCDGYFQHEDFEGNAGKLGPGELMPQG